MGNSEYAEALKEGRDCNDAEGLDCSEHNQEMKFHDSKCLNAMNIEELCSKCLNTWNAWREEVRKNV